MRVRYVEVYYGFIVNVLHESISMYRYGTGPDHVSL